jgi:hypothetical protein
MLCTVCTVHKEMKSVEFLVEPQNQGHRVSQFGPQNQQLRFGDLCLKIIAIASWFVPQNQAGYSLSVAPQNLWEVDGVGHASRSSGLLRLEVSWAKFSQFCFKTGRGATTDDARGIIAEVVWK